MESWQSLFTVEQISKAMKRVLKFRPETKEKVRGKFDKIREKIRKKFPERNPDEAVFVGMHSRRTDYVNFAWKKLSQLPMEEEYYQEAMEYFRYSLRPLRRVLEFTDKIIGAS